MSPGEGLSAVVKCSLDALQQRLCAGHLALLQFPVAGNPILLFLAQSDFGAQGIGLLPYQLLLGS